MQATTLEPLIALNREISALAAAGVPFSEGLLRVSREFSGPTARLSQRLAERIESGDSLAEALEAEGESLPSTYRALVKAGMESGRLTAALEGYTETATRMAELRRVVGLASLYPIFLLVLVWGLFLLVNNIVLPSFDWLKIEDQFWVTSFRFSFFRTGNSWHWLGWVLAPMLLVGGAYFVWRLSAAADEATLVGQTSWLGSIPGIAQVRRLSCEASFADLLRLFIEQQLPLTTALPLAAEGSGFQVASTSMQNLVVQLESGKPFPAAAPAFQQLPPLVRLALLSSRGPEEVTHRLRRATQSYQQRAERWAQSFSFYLPIAATALIGGTSVGAYAILLLQPYVAALHEVVRW